ncbi:hypothetical protein [Mesorhizobium sp. ES1-4]|uniref:hypothetical protein n=1 Tax=Mesorhizobium sp. ES1-4 TaxID=2876627 RepID=UPI001CC937E6|nr:hypothetical protein [Mesorhizobium sp. ES1-4]MBZ9799278.1 hypothetical protein [Mesorhizobium sp. ES1-4]
MMKRFNGRPDTIDFRRKAGLPCCIQHGAIADEERRKAKLGEARTAFGRYCPRWTFKFAAAAAALSGQTHSPIEARRGRSIMPLLCGKGSAGCRLRAIRSGFCLA